MANLLSNIKGFFRLWRIRGFGFAWNYAKFTLFWGTPSFQKLYFEILKMRPSMPKYIEVEVTTKCPLKCIMCEHTYWNETPRDMSFEEYKSIIDQFDELWWIGLTGIGESFLNPDFMRMLRYTRRRFPNIFIELYDNLYFVNEKILRELVNLPVDRILISIEAATKETYEKIRRGAKFERAEENIKKLIELRGDKVYPQIHFHYILLKYNVQEIPLFIKKVREWMDGRPTFIQFTRVLHPFKEVREFCLPEVPDHIISETESLAKKYGIPVGWSKDVPKNKPPVKKCFEWTMPFIFATGHITPCCALNENNKRQWQKEHALGNVFEDKIKNIWNGEKYKRLLESIRKNELPEACEYCPLYKSG